MIINAYYETVMVTIRLRIDNTIGNDLDIFIFKEGGASCLKAVPSKKYVVNILI